MIDDGNPTPADSPEAATLADDGSRLRSSTPIDGGRFAPGTIIDARYRIVALLGRGGMGEVYRADDLKIGETVALKFLPESLATDGAALARFHREVRTARQITHRSVVRVHDIGEVDSMPFISMEYVDGEDLSSLLKRIGRLPQDKAVELSRQLCAGLAAAHERGVLHRDIKPANVMIDGEGRAKISDFGLADLASELVPELAGTPAYMAPEQLREGKASFASDIYSLGLVLYEMFSGRPPFQASTRAELVTLHDSTDPDGLSVEVPGTDPLVDATLRRCLQRDPSQRPASALDVAAALPGGDPLAAALAAGETPSPEMVARADGGALSRPMAAAALVGVLVILGVIVYFGASRFAGTIDPPLEPQVLAHRASEILEQEGWPAGDSTWGFEHNGFGIVGAERSRPLSEWRALAGRRPSFYNFWFRSSTEPLAPQRRWAWRVSPDDPPVASPTIATLELDGQGRLRSLFIPRELGAAEGAGEPDWSAYFATAGLAREDFQEVSPDQVPPVYSDRIHSWRGTYPGQTEPALRIDAASLGGVATWWRLEEGSAPAARQMVTAESRIVLTAAFSMFALLWILGAYFALRHLRSGRGDLRGALRLALFVFLSSFASWLLAAKHVLAIGELPFAFAALSESLMLAAVFWLLYMTIEPFARRFWPRQLTSWTRMLKGEIRNPLVGRDVLLGLLAGCALVAFSMTYDTLFTGQTYLHWRTPHGLRPMLGARFVATNLVHFMALMVPFGIVTTLVIARAVLRRSAPAVVAALLVVTLFSSASQGGFNLYALIAPAVMIFLAVRVGLLALTALGFVVANTLLVPIGWDPSIWWTPNSAISWGAVALVAVLAYRTAVGGSDRAPRPQPER